MRILLLATALTISGSALAYQADPVVESDPMVSVTFDPTVAITPPTTWNDEQRLLWEQHMAFTPAAWTAEQRAAFAAMRAIPPANWTADQRLLYEQHYAMTPSSWTAAQRAAYAAQVAGLRTPWLSHTHTASTGTTYTTGTTTLAAAPASARIVQPSNADPEHDARGIAVISAAAVVPDGYNGYAGTGTGMGGPLVDPATGQTVQGADGDYPACTATVTDNCIQLYERGVRESLATYRRTNGVGGPIEEGNDNTVEDDALDVDTKPDGTLDVDGDLDGDGDNDLE